MGAAQAKEFSVPIINLEEVEIIDIHDKYFVKWSTTKTHLNIERKIPVNADVHPEKLTVCYVVKKTRQIKNLKITVSLSTNVGALNNGILLDV